MICVNGLVMGFSFTCCCCCFQTWNETACVQIHCVAFIPLVKRATHFLNVHRVCLWIALHACLCTKTSSASQYISICMCLCAKFQSFPPATIMYIMSQTKTHRQTTRFERRTHRAKQRARDTIERLCEGTECVMAIACWFEFVRFRYFNAEHP